MEVPKLKPGVDIVQLTSADCARLRDLGKRQENDKQSWGAKIGKLKQELKDLEKEKSNVSKVPALPNRRCPPCLARLAGSPSANATKLEPQALRHLKKPEPP